LPFKCNLQRYTTVLLHVSSWLPGEAVEVELALLTHSLKSDAGFKTLKINPGFEMCLSNSTCPPLLPVWFGLLLSLYADWIPFFRRLEPGGAVQVERSLPTASKHLVSTLEPMK
jgi:hypothetical protein